MKRTYIMKCPECGVKGLFYNNKLSFQNKHYQCNICGKRTLIKSNIANKINIEFSGPWDYYDAEERLMHDGYNNRIMEFRSMIRHHSDEAFCFTNKVFNNQRELGQAFNKLRDIVDNLTKIVTLQASVLHDHENNIKSLLGDNK